MADLCLLRLRFRRIIKEEEAVGYVGFDFEIVEEEEEVC